MTFFRQPLGVLQQLLLSLSSKSIIPPFHLQLLQQQSQGRIRLLRISSNAFSSDGRREVGDKQPEIPESTPSSTTASAPSSPTPAKKQVVSFNENDLEEKFQKGGGPGGQKINKSSSAVVLKHLPTGIIIQVWRIWDSFILFFFLHSFILHFDRLNGLEI